MRHANDEEELLKLFIKFLENITKQKGNDMKVYYNHDEDESLFEEYAAEIASILGVLPSSIDGFAFAMFCDEPRYTPQEAATEYLNVTFKLNP